MLCMHVCAFIEFFVARARFARHMNDPHPSHRLALPDFVAALSEVRASVAPKEVTAYVDWNRQFGTALKAS